MKSWLTKRFAIPAWAFLGAMSIYVELLLHLWTAEALLPGRLAAVSVFALGCGLALGFLAGLFPPKPRKWIAVVIGLLMAVLGLLQFFLNDAYTAFMPLHSVLAGAEGVATGYFSTVVTLLARSLGRISLVLLPVVLYAVFAAPVKTGWKSLAATGVAALALYGAGFGIVCAVELDKPMLSSSYSFDGAVRCFGMNVAMILEPLGGLPLEDDSMSFEIPEQTQAPTQAPAVTEPTRVPDESEPQETTEPTEPPVVYQPHSFDVDYAALAENTKTQKVADLHRYVASLTPAMENEYTGLFEGKNLIFITAEAFTSQVIDPELTPTLYRLSTEGIHFTDYYQILTGCSTTGGEFTNLVGLIPYGGVDSMLEAEQQYLFLTMGHQLQKLGYTSAAFHNNDHTYYNRHRTHTKLGYDTYFAYGNGMEDLITNCWPRSDLEMVDVTLPDYLDQQPFNLYYMSVSGHATYGMNNAMSKKNFAKVEHLPYSKTVKCYLACNLELEYALESMVRMLEEAGIADDTVIVIGSDHYPYGLSAGATWGDGTDYVSELYGRGIQTEQIRDSNSLIIWSGCLEDMDIVVDEPVFSLDILPTLSNLFGLEYDSRLLAGRDVFSEQDALVFWPLTGGWKTEMGYYQASKGIFNPAEGVAMDEAEQKAYIERINAIVRNKISFCRGVQLYDYYDIISEALGITPEG